MNKTLNYILDRLSENSTWRGVIILATSAGVTLKPEQADKVIALGLALVGVINIFRKAPPSAAVVSDAINTGNTTTLDKKSTQ